MLPSCSVSVDILLFFPFFLPPLEQYTRRFLHGFRLFHIPFCRPILKCSTYTRTTSTSAPFLIFSYIYGYVLFSLIMFRCRRWGFWKASSYSPLSLSLEIYSLQPDLLLVFLLQVPFILLLAYDIFSFTVFAVYLPSESAHQYLTFSRYLSLSFHSFDDQNDVESMWYNLL